MVDGMKADGRGGCYITGYQENFSIIDLQESEILKDRQNEMVLAVCVTLEHV